MPVTCYPATNSALSYFGADVPEWINASPQGAVVTSRDGRRYENPDPTYVLETFKKHRGDIVVDINHSTEIRAPKGEESPAVGFVKEMDVRNGEVWARVDWNARGQQAISSQDYRFISPTYWVDKQGRIAGIKSIALTNSPNLYLPALNHSLGSEDNIMDLEKLGKLLSTDPTEISVTAALNALIAKSKDLAVQLNNAQEATPPLEKYIARADYDTMAERAAAAEAKLAELEKAAHDAEVNSLIDKAASEGKISPLTKDSYRAMCQSAVGFKGFQDFVKVAPAILNDSNLDNRPVPQMNALTADELRVCQSIGITEEEFRKARAT